MPEASTEIPRASSELALPNWRVHSMSCPRATGAKFRTIADARRRIKRPEPPLANVAPARRRGIRSDQPPPDTLILNRRALGNIFTPPYPPKPQRAGVGGGGRARGGGAGRGGGAFLKYLFI